MTHTPAAEYVTDNYVMLAEQGWFQGIGDCRLSLTGAEYYPTDVAWALPRNATYAGLPLLKTFSSRLCV